MTTLFQGIFDSTQTTTISVPTFLLCVCTSLLIGAFLAATYAYKTRYTKSFILTLALLPAIVCVVILMVNGNIGAGVAVAGAFSLVRFRSVPGTAREITVIFLAMGAGLVSGMGYLGYAVLFSLILGGLFALISASSFGEPAPGKQLRITIPEDLDYSGVFDDLIRTYTSEHELLSVKTTNMGSLFRLTYNITLIDSSKEKEFIDALRTRNGNLEISISKQEVNPYEQL